MLNKIFKKLQNKPAGKYHRSDMGSSPSRSKQDMSSPKPILKNNGHTNGLRMLKDQTYVHACMQTELNAVVALASIEIQFCFGWAGKLGLGQAN